MTNNNPYFITFDSSLDSDKYDEHISTNEGTSDPNNPGYLWNVFHKDTANFNENNRTYLTFTLPETAPSGDYQIFLTGTWFGRIQEEYIVILNDELVPQTIKFDTGDTATDSGNNQTS